MNFLTEHKIEQYADLVSRIEDVNAENEKTADALKGVEKRLADMAVLMKHVTTYQKQKTSMKHTAGQRIRTHTGQSRKAV